MPQLPSHSNIRLFVHTMLPSSIEAVGCLVGGFLVFVAHLVTVSLNLGDFLTTFFDGDTVATYTNDIIGPFQALIHNSALNTGAVIVLWGLFGLVFYSAISFVVAIVSGWHVAEHEIQFEHTWEVINHPLRRTFLLRTAWRFLVSVITFLFTVAVQPLVHDLLLNDNKLFGTQSLSRDGFNIALSVLLWAAMFHGYVVLLRLYMFRTRLFGEILY